MTPYSITRRSFITGTSLLAVATLSGCVGLLDNSVSTRRTSGNAQAIPNGGDPDDAAIGSREHPRIIASYGGVYEHRSTELMLARMVSNLLAAAEQPNTQFTITILDSSEVNAFALPGGFVYVTRGILALANDLSELAAVIAHEIAHVTLRHARARSNKVRTTQIVDKVITSVLGGVIDEKATAARSALNLASFSQSQELEADKEGIKIAARAGYDPHASARFLTAMSRFAQFASASNGGEDFLSSHPSTPDRIQKAIDAARAYGEPKDTSAERNSYLASVDGIAFGDSTKQGTIIGQRFIHPGLKLTFTVPNGYTLQITDGAVVAVAGNGAALRFDSANMPAQSSLVDYLASGWIAGLQPETIQTQTTNGIAMATASAKTEQWNFRVGVCRIGNTVYRFILAGKEDTASFRNAAAATLNSFRQTSQADLNGLRTIKLQVITARAGEVSDTLAQRMTHIPRGRELSFVLNNLLPGDALMPSASYKIIRVD